MKLMKTQNPHPKISLRWVVALACGFSCLTPWSIDCGPLFPVFLSISTFISVFMCILLYFSPLLCIWIWSIVQHICNNRREREGGRLTMQCNAMVLFYCIVYNSTIPYNFVLQCIKIQMYYIPLENTVQCSSMRGSTTHCRPTFNLDANGQQWERGITFIIIIIMIGIIGIIIVIIIGIIIVIIK